LPRSFSSVCRILRSLNAEEEDMAAVEADSTVVAAVVDSMAVVVADSTEVAASVAAVSVAGSAEDEVPVSVALDPTAAGRIAAGADSRRAAMAALPLHREVPDWAADRLRV
jgi:hypothetical protein